MKRILLLFLLIISVLQVDAQYRAKGFKGGLTLGFQQWNNFQRDALVGYHGAYLIEQINDNNTSYFGEIGYHLKGSAIRSQYININNGNLTNIKTTMKFHNASLIFGAKKRNSFSENLDVYYLAGARLDVTIADSIQLFTNFSNYVNRVNYGLTIGGGFEMPAFKYSQVFLELQISPDFSQQIYVPPGQYYNRFSQQWQQVGEQKVINIVLELSLGIKFLRSQ